MQIVHSSHRGSRDIEHIGSAHDDVELELLKAAALQRLAAGQGVLDLGLDAGAPGGPLAIVSSQMGCLVDALSRGYRVLGFDQATAGDEVFFQLVLARIIEPVSKLDSLRVLEEAGVTPAPYRTVTRRLGVFAADSWRQQISAACTAHAGLGPASLVLYDCSTLYFETDEGDGFRESGFSKERRLEPQITIGLLTGADGFPLMVAAFEGNKAETKTMLPVIEAFMAAHQLPDVTVVADAGMVSEANQKAIEAAGLSFILGAKIPREPYVVTQWRREHPGCDIPDGHIFTQPWPVGPNGGRRDQVIYYQYRHDRARRTLRGIDEQVRKAEQAVAGKVPVKRNRFIRLSGGTRAARLRNPQQITLHETGTPTPQISNEYLLSKPLLGGPARVLSWNLVPVFRRGRAGLCPVRAGAPVSQRPSSRAPSDTTAHRNQMPPLAPLTSQIAARKRLIANQDPQAARHAGDSRPCLASIGRGSAAVSAAG